MNYFTKHFFLCYNKIHKLEVVEIIAMKRFALVMSIIFMILTFVGAGYVLINRGQVNAGYAVVPMSIEFVFASLLSSGKKKDNKDKSRFA